MIRPMARCVFISVEISVTICPRVYDRSLGAMLLQQANKLIDV